MSARLLAAAKVYAFNYLQDEAEEVESCTCGPKQHAEAKELFAAIKEAEAAPLPAEQPSNPVGTAGDFQRGVIAALAVLNSHGYPHGSVYHDSIISTVGDSIYAVADDEDYEWAGLDPSKKPKSQARIVGQQTKGGGNA